MSDVTLERQAAAQAKTKDRIRDEARGTQARKISPDLPGDTSVLEPVCACVAIICFLSTGAEDLPIKCRCHVNRN